jgi:hypothetical protein
MHYKYLATIIITSCFWSTIIAQKSNTGNPFPIVEKGQATSILIDANDAKVVTIAANLFAGDVLNVTGKKPTIATEKPTTTNIIIVAGTLGQNRWIDQLVADKKVDVRAIQGKWESWSVQVIDKPFGGIKKALVIVGSDRRATAYGILELSRQMGVSAWEWWADVKPEKRTDITLHIQNKTYGSPSVKYRGLFLNDEDWGLQPWAAKTFEPETGDIGPKTYAKVFELMLRLRANLIWPAMHSCTKPFYYYPQNKQVADDYAVVVGTSHCEPMLCNINAEWNSKTMGEWRYDNNAETIRNVFEKRTHESAPFENIYTIGMRGEHDSPMNAVELAPDDQIKLLEQVITDQREILRKETGKSPSDYPPSLYPLQRSARLLPTRIEGARRHHPDVDRRQLRLHPPVEQSRRAETQRRRGHLLPRLVLGPPARLFVAEHHQSRAYMGRDGESLPTERPRHVDFELWRHQTFGIQH